jgi:histidine triad (HIT) family protein
MSSIFSKIISREISAKIIYENDEVIAFYDNSPQAPVHVLVVPKTEIQSLLEASPEVIGEINEGIKEVVKLLNLTKDGFRVVINNGRGVGQSVFHLHFHILSGRPFSWPPG